MDVVAPDPPPRADGASRRDLADPATAQRLVDGRPDVIVHLAAVVSGEAEADFDKGYRVNLDGTRTLLEAIRAADGYRPRLVFASSIAVFGAPLPDPDPGGLRHPAAHQLRHPEGHRRAAAGRLHPARLRRRRRHPAAHHLHPAGRPNKAASGFFSNILREPLVGKEAVLPVPETVRHWHASPRSAVGFCLRAATIDTELIGPRRTLSMPGLSRDGRRADRGAPPGGAARQAVRLIRHEPDPPIMEMVDGWAPALDACRAERLGFVAETSFDEIIRVHLEDELHR